MTADFDRLRAVLQRELQAGCDDAVVEGGLDGLLLQQARGEPPGSALLRMVAALPDQGYCALDGAAREQWVKRALATIAMEEAAGAGRSGGRRRGSKRPASPRPRRRQPVRRQAAGNGAGAGGGAPEQIPPGAAALDLPLSAARTRLRAVTFNPGIGRPTTWPSLRGGDLAAGRPEHTVRAPGAVARGCSARRTPAARVAGDAHSR